MKRWKAVFGIVLVISVLAAYVMWSRSGKPAQVEVVQPQQQVKQPVSGI